MSFLTKILSIFNRKILKNKNHPLKKKRRFKKRRFDFMICKFVTTFSSGSLLQCHYPQGFFRNIHIQ